MSWFHFALLTAASFGLYNFFIKIASERISVVLGAFVLQLVATIAGGAWLLYEKLRGTPLSISSSGLAYAALAGLCVGLAEILTFFVYSKGAPGSLGTPLIMGGSIVFGALLSLILLHEKLNIWQYGGGVLIVAGVALLSAGTTH